MINTFLWYVICAELGVLVGHEVKRPWVGMLALTLLVPIGIGLSSIGAPGHVSDALPAAILVLALIVIEALWALWCNSRTFDDQMAAINWAFHSGGDWERKRDLIKQVSYGAHLWRRMTFRDPWAIYPPEVAKAMRLAKLLERQ